MAWPSPRYRLAAERSRWLRLILSMGRYAARRRRGHGDGETGSRDRRWRRSGTGWRRWNCRSTRRQQSPGQCHARSHSNDRKAAQSNRSCRARKSHATLLDAGEGRGVGADVPSPQETGGQVIAARNYIANWVRSNRAILPPMAIAAALRLLLMIAAFIFTGTRVITQ